MKKYSIALLVLCMGSAFAVVAPGTALATGTATAKGQTRTAIETNITTTEKKIADLDKKTKATTNTTVRAQLQKERAQQVKRLQTLEAELARTK